MKESSTARGVAEHEVLAAVLSVRAGERGAALHVLLWERARAPQRGRWALPGGRLRDDEDVETSMRRQLAEKVDVREVAHVEQLAVLSAPGRHPGPRRIATAFLGIVPADADPALPADTRWWPAAALPDTAFDHGTIVGLARDRLRAKLSYTNVGYALAPREFTVSALRELYAAALGHDVDATNLQRFLTRRGQLEPTGTTVPAGRRGGRPAAAYRFRERRLEITDEFVAFRPPTR